MCPPDSQSATPLCRPRPPYNFTPQMRVGGVVCGVVCRQKLFEVWNFMSEKKELTKEAKVKREKNRLNKVFKALDKNKLDTVRSLINTAAFIAVTLDELQEIINTEGYISEYKNGANQWGKKQSEAVEIHISMTRNLTTIIKQLTDLAPAEKRKDGKLMVFQRTA